MLDEAYLVHGLDALSRAHQTDYFADGHRGAAIMAAYYLCREVQMEDGAGSIVRAMIDKHWAGTGLCAPFPEEPSEPEQVSKIVECLRRHIAGLRQAGHNVIFPSLALKAFRQMPQTVTPARVTGICKLIESFTVVDNLRLEASEQTPDLSETPDGATFILSELPRAVAAFDGRGQGWSGHLLTYGRAILDLRRSGYDSLARAAEQGFGIYVKRIRMGPLETDRYWVEHPPDDARPHQREYWVRRRERPIGIGHVFKYPYGYCGLMDLAEDPKVRLACEAVAYHVL